MTHYYIVHTGTQTILDADECTLVVDDTGRDYSDGRIVRAALNHGTALPVRGVRIKLDGGLVRGVEGYDQHGAPVLPVPTTVWDYDIPELEDGYELKLDEDDETYIEYGA